MLSRCCQIVISSNSCHLSNSISIYVSCHIRFAQSPGYHMHTTWISHVHLMGITCTPHGYQIHTPPVSCNSCFESNPHHTNIHLCRIHLIYAHDVSSLVWEIVIFWNSCLETNPPYHNSIIKHSRSMSHSFSYSILDYPWCVVLWLGDSHIWIAALWFISVSSIIIVHDLSFCGCETVVNTMAAVV